METMTREIALTRRNDGQSILDHLRDLGWNRNTCGAILGLLGGFLAPVVGSILTALGWITGPTWHGVAVQRMGAVFLFLTIPLLLLGAHCLDLEERRRKH